MENPKEHTHTHTQSELKTTFSEVVRYKFNIKKSALFLYTRDELSENEID